MVAAAKDIQCKLLQTIQLPFTQMNSVGFMKDILKLKTVKHILTRNPQVIWDEPHHHLMAKNNYAIKSPLVTMACPTLTPKTAPSLMILTPI